MNVPQDRRSARELVQSITKKHGHLATEQFARISDPQLRREVEEAFMAKDLLIGSSVITLARNLYSSNARFVFELLQNADDNHYKRARALKTEPFISFNVYHDRIVVECNEDGFTPENLTAVCAVGKSSKTGAQGYIGAKGIGFKSVFMVAWKVHIQSGSLTFSFTHRPGDSGMGMISPAWEDAVEELASPLTRMTLYLRDEAMEDGILKDSIHRQLADIQDNFLLFMRNLKEVSVRFHDDSGQETSHTTYKCQDPGGLAVKQARLTRTTVVSNETTESSKYFQVYTHQAVNLASHDDRTYSDEAKAFRFWSTSTIVLAFPVTSMDLPIVERQDLFVFMPVRSVGMNFIIQADFVTDANRQDVVADSQRNIDLINEVAEAFVRSVINFCKHPTLKYQWMRYLPGRDNRDRGRLWISLVERIALRLAQSEVVLSHYNEIPCRMSQLSLLTPSTLDANGQPLFADVTPETMLSTRYTSADAQTLSTYGALQVNWQQIMAWLQHDLKQGSASRMRSPTTTEVWHTRVATLLSILFGDSGAKRTVQELRGMAAQELRGMAIVPLSDGNWGSVSPRSAIYFPVVDEVDLEIPSRTRLRTVHRSVTDPKRLALFKCLGVQIATVDLVRQHIIQEYFDKSVALSISLEHSKQHVDFLFKTQSLADEDETGMKEFTVFTNKGTQVRPSRSNLYLKTDDPFGPWELTRETEPGSNIGDGAPGLDVDFLHSIYLQDATAASEGVTEWTQWIYDKLGVQRNLKFASAEGVLNSVASYLEEHRPEKFLGALQAWFANNQEKIDSDLIETLQSTYVLTRHEKTVWLEDTYFPTEKLESQVNRYVEPNSSFPWLWLGPDMSTQETIPRNWRALIQVLQIGNQLSDLEFALDMLRISLETLQSMDEGLLSSRKTLERLLRLYSHVSTFEDEESPFGSEGIIRRFFYDDDLCPIYVPAKSADETSTWAIAQDCVWHAPRLMVSKTVISLMWERFLPQGLQFRNLEYFFTNVVEVSKYDVVACVNELRALSKEPVVDIDDVKLWYEELDRLQESSVPPYNNLRQLFEDESLIYAPSAQGPSWRESSECVWSTASRLRGKPSLNDDYEDLRHFFVDFLGVKPVDLQMAVDELQHAANGGSSIDAIRDSIWTVNSLLKVTAEWPKSSRTTKSRVFPVRFPSGEVSCLSERDEFFVIDREPYRVAFERHVKLMNFSLAEVAELDPFLRWTGLGDRYLSNCVKEVTSFGSGDAEVIQDMNMQICNRAHALLRIAKHFGSPRVSSISAQEAFYELLRSTQLLGTDGVSSGIELKQDERTYTERGKSNAVFIREHESQLKVYLPLGRSEQVHAFKIKLPRRFLEWMMTDPATQLREAINDKSISAAEHVFGTEHCMLEETLEDDGITKIDIENVDSSPDDADAESIAEAMADLHVVDQADSGTFAESQGHTSQAQPITGFADDDEDSDSGAVAVYTPTTVSASSSWQATSAPSRVATVTARLQPLVSSHAPIAEPITPPRAPSDDASYTRLLEYVVRAARAAELPQWSEPGQIGLRLDGNNRSVHVSGRDRFERNCKVGAAGELFVFELLSNLEHEHESLPHFTRDNWQSRVREYARAHEEYTDMEPWYGVETSDIVYSDAAGILTTLLREKGYFEDLWTPGMEKPSYFIEVKTTTSDSRAPFYMNSAQYALMQNSTLESWNGPNIYVIFRIHNLGQENMELQIYLDPERQRQQGQLVFAGERWAVTPGTD